MSRRFLQVLDQPANDSAAEPARARLVPRFTIRTLLAMITLAAIIFVMIGTATRGQYWAWGVTIGLVSVIVTALAHAAWFGIVWMFMRISHGQSEPFESAAQDAGTSRAPQADGTGSEMFSVRAGKPGA
ncbi:MAG TPA: hypothetical protein VJ828_15190 [Lacipirellulaceae bacterium]|nr:hypothetical protein [Lacipirellulaceae bacterium]